jgi:hypothetical protein
MDAMAHRQLSLFMPRWTAEGLEAWLTAQSGRLVRLVFTRNRASMVSVRFDPLGMVRLRVDRAFGQAPDAVIDALGRYLRTRHAGDWQVVSHYAGSLTPTPRPAALRQLLTQGRVHDLAVIRDRVNHEYFQGRLACRIGWGALGRRHRRARTRSIRYGSYVKAQDLVRINPLLDDLRVPADFVAYIVFHEMLHAVVPSEPGVRRRHHHAMYRRLEQRFPDFERMRRLSSELVNVLGT